MKKGKVAVIGLTGQSAFLSTKYFPRPGETVSCDGLFFEPGGKGHNQAIACARTGIDTIFISAVGHDMNGDACKKALEKENIHINFIEKNEMTAFAAIVTAENGENIVEVYGGAAKAMQAEDLDKKEVREQIAACDYLLLQNELPEECLKKAIEIANEVAVPIILNPAPARELEIALLSKCWMITPNFGEAKALAGYASEDEPTLEELAIFFRKCEIENTVITLGGKGVCIITDSICEQIPAFSAGAVIDTTGAGDTFNGTLVGMLAGGKSLEEAIRNANVAAGISVTRAGAAGSIPTMQELQEKLFLIEKK